MVTCWRFLQTAALSALLAACAAPHTPAPPAPGEPAAASGAQASSPPSAPPAPEGSGAPARRAAGTPAAARPELKEFARALADSRNLDEDRALALLEGARYSPAVARAIRPAPRTGRIVRSWPVYRGRFVEPRRIRSGRTFLRDYRTVLEQAERRYGVPASVIVAIIGVETLYGANTGNFRILDALSTLAFDYPDPARPDRARMFRDQLADFVELALQGRLDPGVRGSYAGALGLPQFMPGSLKRYAVDGDGDGKTDLMYSVPDAVMSVANFLVEHGWQPGLPVFAPVRLPPDPAPLVDGGLAPHLSWRELQGAGASPIPSGGNPAWQRAPLGVIDLPDESAGTVQYRTATPNFFALTQYNRSYFYASAVADLAEAIVRD